MEDRAEQQASRNDIRCDELVDETALYCARTDRARTNRVQPELLPTFTRRDELDFVGIGGKEMGREPRVTGRR